MKRALLVALLLLAPTVLADSPGAAGALGGAEAQQLWSVQVIALRDLREAQSLADRLRGFGFDAYTEFAMDRGLQFVRVRVGCYLTRGGAEAVANALRPRVTNTAVAVEASAGPPVHGCVRMEIGFLKPIRWNEVSQRGEQPAYLVEVAGVEAHVTHTGERWHVVQQGQQAPASEANARSARFAQGNVHGQAFVKLEDVPGGLLLCPGKLLNSVGPVAIVEQDDALVACSIE